MIRSNLKKLFSSMKELIKPNAIDASTVLIDTSCGEQKIGSCPRLKCICDGKTNESIESEEIIF